MGGHTHISGVSRKPIYLSYHCMDLRRVYLCRTVDKSNTMVYDRQIKYPVLDLYGP
jgi:hypothetical protein